MPDSYEDKRIQFTHWYEQGMPRLYNFIAYQVLDRQTAEDLTSRVCERALRHLDRYDPQRGSLDTWIYAIARNTLRNHFRSHARRPRHTSLEALPPFSANGTHPERRVEMMDTFKRVMGQLHHLPARQREAIALRFGGGLSNGEIAEVMGISANHAGVLLHRALTRLKKAVNDAEEMDNA